MHDTQRRAIGYMVLAVLSFTALDAAAKYLTKFYAPTFVVWGRYFFHCAVMLLIFAPKRGLSLIKTERPKLQIARGVALVGSSLFFFSALQFMALPDAQSVALLAPVLVTFAAAQFLKEPLPKQTWWVLLVSFTGVLLVVKPGTSVFTPATFLALGSALCFTAYQLLTRMVAQVDDHLATLFIGGLIGAVVASAALPWTWQWPQSWAHGGLFLLTGVIGAGGHLLMVKSYELASASRLAPFVYLQIIGGLFWGWLVFGTFPDGWALVGMVMIALVGITNALLGRRATPA